MKNIILIFGLTLVLFLSLATPSHSWSLVQDTDVNDNNPLSVKASLSTLEWNPGQSGQLMLDLSLPAGFRAYEDQFQITIYEPDGFKMGKLEITPIVSWEDKFLKKKKTGIISFAKAKMTLEAPSKFITNPNQLKFEISYQACNDQFCLFPTAKTLFVPIKLIGAPQPAPKAVIAQDKNINRSDKPSFLSVENFSEWMSLGWLPSLLFVFLAGILTSFTPCIFPMIPITLAVLGHHAEKRTRLQNFSHSIIYVLGIATTYSSMGVIAALSGGIFGASLGNPWVLSTICILLLAMSLSMYGLFEIQVPAVLRNKFGNKKSKDGISGTYFTGLFAGIVASPCVGPVLVAILTYVSLSKNIFLGFTLLFTYALGLGLIFILLGAYSELAKKLPRSGPWMELFKFSLGTFMLGAFYYYLSLLIPMRWFDLSLGLGLVVLASTYGAFLKNNSVIGHIKKGMLQAVLFIGFAYLIVGALDLRPYINSRMISEQQIKHDSNLNWIPYSEAALKQAQKNQQPVIIDFWANWCAACHELEEATFTDPVVKEYAKNFVLLKFDATSESPELKVLKRTYRIQGLPTILFFDKNGQWQSNLTLTQFEEPRSFTGRMQKALE